MGVEPDNAVSDPSYYTGQSTLTPPKFMGRGSRLLGIEGQWSKDAFHNLFAGYSPDGSKKLARRIDKDRRGAVDWTFNQPKAVSVAELVGGDTRITMARERAVEKAFKAIEKQARVLVRKQSQLLDSKRKGPKGWKYPARNTDNLIATAFSHPESRSGDPAGHHHLVIQNLSWDADEGIWKAVELRYVDRKGISDVYHREFAKGLRRLGYQAKWDGKEMSFKGVGEKVCDEFSQRHQAVKETEGELKKRANAFRRDKAAKKGLSPEEVEKTVRESEAKPLPAKVSKKLAVFDRPEKPADVPLPERRKEWFSRLTKPELTSVRNLVSTAKATVSLARFHAGLREHSQKLRTFAFTRESGIERGQDRERGKGGWQR